MKAPDTTLGEAIDTIEATADFWHSMDIDPENDYYRISWLAALDLLERIQGLEEYSLYKEHLTTCEDCKEIEANGKAQSGF